MIRWRARRLQSAAVARLLPRQYEALAAVAQLRTVRRDAIDVRAFLHRVAFLVAVSVDEHEPLLRFSRVDVQLDIQRRQPGLALDLVDGRQCADRSCGRRAARARSRALA